MILFIIFAHCEHCVDLNLNQSLYASSSISYQLSTKWANRKQTKLNPREKKQGEKKKRKENVYTARKKQFIPSKHSKTRNKIKKKQNKTKQKQNYYVFLIMTLLRMHASFNNCKSWLIYACSFA